MELISGNIFIRVPGVRMSAGSVVVGHTHNFDHTTFCSRGALQIDLLPRLPEGHDGAGVEPEETIIVRAGSEQPWALILAGRHHRITALENNSSYLCIYAHRYPQALNPSEPGNIDRQQYTRRDDDGTLWVRVDESIVQDSNSWSSAYV